MDCRVCGNAYSASVNDLKPRVLACGHSVCLGCARKLVRTSGNEGASAESPRSPRQQNVEGDALLSNRISPVQKPSNTNPPPASTSLPLPPPRLQTTIRAKANINEVHRFILCPFDRHETVLSPEGPEGLKINYNLVDMIETLARQRTITQGQEEAKQCQDCSKAKAATHCPLCKKDYCTSCTETNHTAVSQAAHRQYFTPVSAKQRPANVGECPIHGDLLRVYCKTDDRIICSSCAHEEHKDHDITFSPASVLAESKKSLQITNVQAAALEDELATAFAKINAAAEKIKAATSSVEAIIDQTATSIIQLVLTMKGETLKKLNRSAAIAMEPLNALVNELNPNLVAVRAAVGHADQCLKDAETKEKHPDAVALQFLLGKQTATQNLQLASGKAAAVLATLDLSCAEREYRTECEISEGLGAVRTALSEWARRSTVGITVLPPSKAGSNTKKATPRNEKNENAMPLPSPAPNEEAPTADPSALKKATTTPRTSESLSAKPAKSTPAPASASLEWPSVSKPAKSDHATADPVNPRGPSPTPPGHPKSTPDTSVAATPGAVAIVGTATPPGAHPTVLPPRPSLKTASVDLAPKHSAAKPTEKEKPDKARPAASSKDGSKAETETETKRNKDNQGDLPEDYEPPSYANLFTAVEASDWLVVRFLIEKRKMDPNTVDNSNRNRWTALHHAVAKNNLEMVKYLINQGARPELQTVGGETALYKAAYHGHYEIAEYLLRNCNDIRASNSSAVGPTPTRRLCDIRDSYSYTVLHPAARSGLKKLVSLLIKEYHMDPNDAENESKWTPLHYAAFNGHLSTVQSLVDRGAQVGLKNKAGNTALELAAAVQKPAIVAFLQQKS